MPQKIYANTSVEVTDLGYLVNLSDWKKEMAIEIAMENHLELTDTHFAMLEYIRNEYIQGRNLTIRAIGKSGIVDIKGFYELFPGGPLKLSSKIAGIPKPSSCT